MPATGVRPQVIGATVETGGSEVSKCQQPQRVAGVIRATVSGLQAVREIRAYGGLIVSN